jgi:hypothetical protein
VPVVRRGCNLRGQTFAGRQRDLGSFLAIGQRTECPVGQPIRFDDPAEANALRQSAQRSGRLASVVCKDYFLFTPDLFAAEDIPDFRIGRGNWDNWMVHTAHRRGVPVVDLTGCVLAIHPQHGHDHVPGGRGAVYVTGPDARYNQRVAGGRHLVSGSLATWKLGNSGLKKLRFPHGRLLADLPRFVRLLRDLLISGYITGLGALNF